MLNFPELYTRRLTLRKLEGEDIPALVRLANNKKISDQIVNIPYPYQEPDAAFRISYIVRGFKEKSRYIFAIIQDDPEAFIGEVSLHLHPDEPYAELGYWIGEPYWSKGYATEASKAIIKFGFEQLNLELIFATCHAENGASCKVASNIKMKKDHMNGNVIQYRIYRKNFQG